MPSPARPLAVLESRSVPMVPDRLTDVDHWHPHIPLAFFLVELLAPRRVVELGTWKGDSYCAFCQAVDELGLDTRAMAIDTWRGDAQTGAYGPEVLDGLRDYHDPRYERFSQLVQSTFDEVLAEVGDGSVDLLHIDGCHEYEVVRHDFESWLPKLSDSSVVLFHDTQVRRPGYGVGKLWEEVSAARPSVAFFHGFGLGVLVVGKAPSAAVVDFVEASSNDGGATERLFGVLGERVVAIGRERRTAEELAQARAELEQLRADRDRLVAGYGRVEELELHLHEVAAKVDKLQRAYETERAARRELEDATRSRPAERLKARARAAYTRLRAIP